eukprot:jgi/Botrbrau1/7745/Bobra.0159s0175.1
MDDDRQGDPWRLSWVGWYSLYTLLLYGPLAAKFDAAMPQCRCGSSILYSDLVNHLLPVARSQTPLAGSTGPVPCQYTRGPRLICHKHLHTDRHSQLASSCSFFYVRRPYRGSTMRITIEIEVQPEEFPAASQLISTLRTLTNHVQHKDAQWGCCPWTRAKCTRT